MTKLHINTPLIHSLSMNKNLEGNIFLKMESLQPCGSFKLRGVAHGCEHYIKKGAKRLISSSGGNAGLAVAYSGRCLGVPVTVVVPETTKKRAKELIKLEGADLIIKGKNWDEAHAHAVALAGKDSAYIHPFDDPLLWEGHGSVIDEVVSEGIIPDGVVLSVGGGGLLCGVVEGLQRNNLNNVPVLAVETKGAESLNVALKAGKHVGLDSINTIATSLGSKKIADRAFELFSEHRIESKVVSDKEALTGCFKFLEDHRVMVEPACGASLSVIYNGCKFLENKKNILVIVCGGVGVSIKQLEEWQKQLL